VLALALLAAAPAGAQGPTPPGPAEALLDAQPRELVARLFEKKVVLLESRGASPMVEALVLFQQPHAKTLAMLMQTARQPEFRPELESVREVERMPDGVVEEQRMKIMFVNIVYRLHYTTRPDAARIEWKLDPRFDNAMQEVQGFWELYPLDAGNTLARFGTVVNVGPALPGFLQDWATRKNVPQTLERTRRWVDSDGKWRP
jgi:hypothetical protein